jgi:hypothetical protein
VTGYNNLLSVKTLLCALGEKMRERERKKRVKIKANSKFSLSCVVLRAIYDDALLCNGPKSSFFFF